MPSRKWPSGWPIRPPAAPTTPRTSRRTWTSWSSSAFTCTVSSATAASRSATTANSFTASLRSRRRLPRSVRVPSSASRGPTASIRPWGPSRAHPSMPNAPGLLDLVKGGELNAVTRSLLYARRAGVWAAIAYEQERRGEAAGAAAQRALAELLAVNPHDLGDDRRPEYVDAVLRVSAIRWTGALPAPQPGTLTLMATPGKSWPNVHRPRGCKSTASCRRAAALHLRTREDGLDPGHSTRSGFGAGGAAARELARALGLS